MSMFSFTIEHEQQLWVAHESGADIKFYPHEIVDSDIKLNFSDFGIKIFCDLDIDPEIQRSLAECLIREPHPGHPHIPQWQHLTPDLHQIVKMIEERLFEGAKRADHGFRRIPKGIRLPPAKISSTHWTNNRSEAYSFIAWVPKPEEWSNFEDLLEKLTEPARNRYRKNGISIPFSSVFKQKQIHLNDDDVAEAFRFINGAEEIQPFWVLYGIAWDNFVENRATDAAILILTTAIETALKWCLANNGDGISKYLIENVQSPPLKSLYVCACENTPLELPDHFGSWLGQLSMARNFAAHKPREFEIDKLQIGRWFALGEAILKSISGYKNDPMVGYLVKAVGEKATEHFAEDTRAVVLRREEFRGTGESRLHVLVETGETYYFSDTAYELLPTKQQKFHDIK